MAAFEPLLGSTLVGKSGDVATSDALKGKVTAFYFSAHWCGPCRGFTPQLAEAYVMLTSGGKPFEIVFVSSDRDQASFDEYYGEMPWLALPFSERERKNDLSKKYGVRGIPSLVILDAEGKVITKDGRAAISGDPSGADFPWVPPTLSELLGDEFRGPGGAVVPKSALAGKSLALYFSAHWCPPCRGFTPQLAKTYAALKAARGAEVEFIFVSSDRDEASFNEYHDSMGFLALPFSRRKEKEQLSSMFEVQGIPTLITLDAEGSLVNKNARGACAGDPDGKAFPWPPAPLEEMSATVECNGFDVNEKAALVVLCDGASAEEKEACKAAALEVATEVAAAVPKGSDEGPPLIFFTACDGSGPVPQVKGLCGLSGPTSQPALLLLDIPDDGGFYTTVPEGGVSAAAIREFIAAYNAKTLTRSQLKK